MGRPGRKGRVLKWAATLLLPTTVIVWLLSAWWQGYISISGGRDYATLGLANGRLTVQIDDFYREGRPITGVLFLTPSSIKWSWFSVDWRPALSVVWPFFHVSIPLWMRFLPMVALAARLRWLDRERIPPGYRRKCEYDLTGNVSGVCPECGERIGATGREAISNQRSARQDTCPRKAVGLACGGRGSKSGPGLPQETRKAAKRRRTRWMMQWNWTTEASRRHDEG
jgi:hypothetical protein